MSYSAYIFKMIFSKRHGHIIVMLISTEWDHMRDVKDIERDIR